MARGTDIGSRAQEVGRAVLFLENFGLAAAEDPTETQHERPRAPGSRCGVGHPDGHRLLFIHPPPEPSWDGWGSLLSVPAPG